MIKTGTSRRTQTYRQKRRREKRVNQGKKGRKGKTHNLRSKKDNSWPAEGNGSRRKKTGSCDLEKRRKAGRRSKCPRKKVKLKQKKGGGLSTF